MCWLMANKTDLLDKKLDQVWVKLKYNKLTIVSLSYLCPF